MWSKMLDFEAKEREGERERGRERNGEYFYERLETNSR